MIIVKIIEDRLWRFSSADLPFRMEGFDKTSRQEIRLETSKLAASIAERFGMNDDKIAQALSYKHLI